MKRRKSFVAYMFLGVILTACKTKDNESPINETKPDASQEIKEERNPQELSDLKTPAAKTEIKEVKSQISPIEVLREITLPYKMATLPDKYAMADYVANYDKNPIKGDIIIFFVDTLRYDMTLKYAPTVKEFMSKTLSGKQIATGTATTYPLFSIFHSQPSFLTYKDYLSTAYDETDRGSFFFQLLKKQGYNIYAFGRFFNCWSIDFPHEYKYLYTENVSIFGQNTHLLSNCSEEIYSGYPATYDTSQANKRNEDQLKIDRFKTIYEKNKETGQHAVYIIEQFGVHGAFTWLNTLENLPYPHSEHLNDVINLIINSNYSHKEIHQAYANAVYSMDKQFNKLIDYLKTHNRYDDTTLIFFSDHGESLGEVKLCILKQHIQLKPAYSHSNTLLQEQIDTPFAIKFSNKADKNYTKQQDYTISGIDLLPTLFDGLSYGLEDAKEFYKGQSVINSIKEEDKISILANWVYPPSRLIVTNKKHKAHIYINEKDFYNANQFKLIGIHTYDDKPIDDIHERETLINNFEAIFASGIDQVFPRI